MRYLSAIVLICLSHLVTGQCIMTLQPDSTQGKDTRLWSLSCSSSYALANNGQCESMPRGSDAFMGGVAWTWDGTPAIIRGLLEFDLDSLATSGCTVSQATLVLHHSVDNPSQFNCGSGSTAHPCNSNAFSVHRVTQSWDEHTVIWATQPTYATTVAGQDSVSVPNDADPFGGYSIDLTDMVNFWLTNPGLNYGMMLKLTSETYYARTRFATSNHPDSFKRPKLVLELNCPNSCENLISGTIFDDQTPDCNQAAGEPGLANWIVKVEPGPYYANTDANGHYEVVTGPGTHTVTQIIPNHHLWDSICPLPYQYSLNMLPSDTVENVDFAVHADNYCPQLTVDIGATFVRPCHLRKVFVEYCNEGNAMATGVYLDIEFDSLWTPQASSLPWQSSTGNVYTFWVDTLMPGDCGLFDIDVFVDCAAQIGEWTCVEATIFPADTCSQPIDPTWDKSSVMVTGQCQDSLACFTITNTGDPLDGDMQGTSEYRIFVDGVLVFVGNFQLLGGADTTICWPSYGHTVRLEADQRPGHPGNSHPNDILNCGSCGSPSCATPPVLQPQDDADSFVEQECVEVRAGYDPNDKSVVPAGLGASQIIEEHDYLLEYKIRFQNTGNDTAFNITVMDTLDPNLDITTINPGVSSHYYEWRIIDSNILEFHFPNIQLVDSGTNEPLSHGFFKFKIERLAGIPHGTVISNRVGIIFDINIPVMTNYAWVTIAKAPTSVSVPERDLERLPGVNVFPNPAQSTATFQLAQSNRGSDFMLMDLQGRILLQRKHVAQEFDLDCSSFKAGVYVFTLTDDQGRMRSGRLVVR